MKYLSDVNWIAVLVATVVGFVLGALWFSPLLFSNRWMAALGKSKEELGKSGPALGPALALSFAVTFITALALAVLLVIMPLTTTLGALRLGLMLGVVFYALATATDYVYTGWPRTIYWIQASYHVLMIAIMAVIIAAWR
ncbi:MAG: DUF1761 domain-containing protein [Gemmatimonadaceae bacterium]